MRDVILPAPSPLRAPTTTWRLYLFAVRNVANYSPPVLGPHPDLPDEWVTLLRLAGVAAGLGPDADVAVLDEQRRPRAGPARLETPAARRSSGATSRTCYAALEPRADPSGCST